MSVRCAATDRRPPVHITPRELEELRRTDPDTFERLACEVAGCYAYTLGYRDGRGVLQGLRREPGLDSLPILADRPPFGEGPNGEEGVNSPNHGGVGQNVLHVGGHVDFYIRRNIGPGGDDIYLNQNHRVAAGLHAQDTVLGASPAHPGTLLPPNE